MPDKESKKHIVFIDCTGNSIETLFRALDRGFSVSLYYNRKLYEANVHTYFSTLPITGIVELDTLDEEELFSALSSSKVVIDAVINVRDASILVSAKVCSRLNILFTSPRGIKNCLDKSITRLLTQEANQIPVRSVLVEHVSNIKKVALDFGFPLVIKPKTGHSSLLCYKVENSDELELATSELVSKIRHLPDFTTYDISSEFVVEEFIVGDILSVELAIQGPKKVRLLLSGRTSHNLNPCIGLGSIVPAIVDEKVACECFEYAEKICNLIELDYGIFNIEIVYTADGPRLLEVNPRCMGGRMLRAYEIAFRKSFHDFLIDLSLARIIYANHSEHFGQVLIRKLITENCGRITRRLDFSVFNQPFVEIKMYNMTTPRLIDEMEIIGRIIISHPSISQSFRIAEELTNQIGLALNISLLNGKELFY